MDQMVNIAAAVFPEILSVVSNDNPDSVAKVIAAVTGATGAKTADEAKVKLADPAQATAVFDLKTRLAAIVTDSAQTDDATLEDTKDARKTLLALATVNDKMASTPAIISYIVVFGFVALVFAISMGWTKLFVLPDANGHVDPAASSLAQLANICIGALAAGFSTVLNFWLGSSLGSRRKDFAAAQETNAKQIRNMGGASGS